VAFGVWLANWIVGILFFTRVAPFEGTSLRIVRRRLDVALPSEAGYRDDGETGARVSVDGQPIERRRLQRVALGRFHEPLGKSTPWDPWSVNLILSDGIVRVAKLREAAARRLAEALAAALDVEYEPEEVADITNLASHPLHWSIAAAGLGQGAAASFLPLIAGFHGTAVGWVIATAFVLAMDVVPNELLGLSYLRRRAEADVRAAFRESAGVPTSLDPT
jgi:hypothetical protein